MRLPASLAVLRRRDYRLLLTAQTASLIGDGVTSVALAFAVLELTGSATDLGVVLAAQMVPLIGFLLVGGVAGDRWSRRTVMVGADLIRAAALGAMGVLVVTGTASIPALAVLAAVAGSASAFFQPALAAVLPQAAGEEHLQQANALRGSAIAGGEIAGPAIAGILVVASGPGWALVADGASFLVSAALLARLSIAGGRSEPSSASFVAELRDGWNEFRSRTWLWTTVTAASVGNLSFGAYAVLGPLVAARSLGGAGAWAAITGSFGTGAVAGGLLALRIRPRRPLRTAALAIAVFALPLSCLALRADLLVVAGAAALAGAGLMVANALFETAMQQHVPSHALARVSSYDWLGSLALQPIGFVLWGPIAAFAGLDTALWAAAVLHAATALALLLVPDVRRLPARTPLAV